MDLPGVSSTRIWSSARNGTLRDWTNEKQEMIRKQSSKWNEEITAIYIIGVLWKDCSRELRIGVGCP